jgi:flagellar hook-length control protein FliK
MQTTSSKMVGSEMPGMRRQSNLAGEAPARNDNGNTQPVEKGIARNFRDWFMPENNGGLKQASSNMQANTVGFDANNPITIPVSEVGSSLPQLDANNDLSQVRFYNLDQKLDQLKSNPGQKINIQLVPARLGKMELSVINHRGIVTVQLTLESMQARQSVERNLGQLERHLASSGIRVDSFQLHVNQPLRGGSFAHFQQHYDQPRDGFNNRQDHGRQQYAQEQRQMRRFGLSDNGFAQTMINCLA